MGSKPRKDLFSSPNRESQDGKQGNEGRQLRSRLVETCRVCNRPLATAASRSSTSHAHCTCVTPPPGPSTAPEFTASASPRKKKIHLEVVLGESSKRQLFKDTTNASPTVPQPKVIEGDGGECSTSFASASRSPAKDNKVKSDDEKKSKKAELKPRHPCNLCSKSFNTPGKLSQHMFSHTGEKPFVCDHCTKAFSSKFKLSRHLLIHTAEKPHMCPICERTFHRKDHLKNHSKVHSPTKIRYKCDRAGCTKEYSSVSSYKKHMAHHSAEEGDLECKLCKDLKDPKNEVFESTDELKKHLKTHMNSRTLKGPADRKHRCEACCLSFVTIKDVKRHTVVHTGSRDFGCEICPQRFGRSDHLRRHVNKIHLHPNKKQKAKRTVGRVKSKTVGNILKEMFDEKAAAVVAGTSASALRPPLVAEHPSALHSATDDLYKMQGLDSPVDVTKLESSTDIVPMDTLDDKSVLPTKVEHDLELYGMPMINPNIPFEKYEQYQYETFPAYRMRGPSTSTMTPDAMSYQHQPPPLPPYTVDLAAAFDPESMQVKMEVEYAQQTDESATLDLVLPPIENIPSSMANFQNLLSTSQPGAPSVHEQESDNNEDPNIDQLLNLNLLPNSELLASLLSSSDPSTALPGFNEAFHPPQ